MAVSRDLQGAIDLAARVLDDLGIKEPPVAFPPSSMAEKSRCSSVSKDSMVIRCNVSHPDLPLSRWTSAIRRPWWLISNVTVAAGVSQFLPLSMTHSPSGCESRYRNSPGTEPSRLLIR